MVHQLELSVWLLFGSGMLQRKQRKCHDTTLIDQRGSRPSILTPDTFERRRAGYAICSRVERIFADESSIRVAEKTRSQRALR